MNNKRPSASSDEPVETALAVLSAGWATNEEIVEAVAARRTLRPTIGQLLLIHHKLNVHQVFQILGEQATSSKLFGQIAIDMGFIKESDVNEILQLQSSLCPPLWQVLESRGVITPAQAESIQSMTRSRLRQPSDESLETCEA
jgi:hypothetical protein